MDWGRLTEALRQLVEGLLALHGAGKLHRDIKPSNTLVRPDGHLLLMDFGLVVNLRGAERTVTAERAVGTPAYMSPEQGEGEDLTEASDWYAVGVLLSEALTGRLPFSGDPEAMREQKRAGRPLPFDEASERHAPLERLCERLLHPAPTARPGGEEILECLGAPRRSVATRPASGPSTPLVGRRRELETLDSAFTEMARGKLVTARIYGVRGAGKTALVRTFLERAERDAIVLEGRCYEQESTPYKGLDALVDSLSRYLVDLSGADAAEAEALVPADAGPLARVFPVLKRVSAIRRWAAVRLANAEPREIRRRAFASLCEVLRRVGERRPLVLCVDDLQWGDADSAELLANLVQPPAPIRMLLLAVYQGERRTESPCLDAIDPASRADRDGVATVDVPVEPLSEDEARSLARRFVKSETTVEEIGRESGGIPYLIDELVRGLQQETEGVDAVASVGVTELLWNRVRRLPPEAEELLKAVAVAGHPVRFTHACQTFDAPVTPETVHRLRVESLIQSIGPRWLDTLAPYHDRVRDAVATHLDDATWRAWHRRLAEVCEAAGDVPAETVATHYEEAGDAAHAGEHYLSAADHAAEALAFDRAADFYRRALRLRPMGADEVRSVRTALADALANAGRSAAAGDAYLAAAEDAPRAERIDLEHRAAFQFYISGRLVEGGHTLRRVARRVWLRCPRHAVWALATMAVNRLFLRLRGLRYRERAARELSAARLRRIDVTWSATAGLSMIDTMVGADFQAQNLTLALSAGEPYRLARALAWEAAHRANRGGEAVAETAALLEEAERLVRRIEHPHAIALVALSRGLVAFTLGQWRRARERLEEAETTLRERCTGVVWELGTAQTFSLWASFYSGAFREMDARSQAMLREADARGDLYLRTYLTTFTRPLAALGGDRADLAAETLEACQRDWPQTATNLQQVTSLFGWTYVDLYRGRPEEARTRLLREAGPLRRSQYTYVQVIRVLYRELLARASLAAAARSGGRRNRTKAARLAERVQREGMPYADALAAGIRAGLAHLDGDDAAAADLLRGAAARFDEAEMGLFAAAARRGRGLLLAGADPEGAGPEETGRSLVREADAWMESEGIHDPARMASTFLPWLRVEGLER